MCRGRIGGMYRLLCGRWECRYWLKALLVKSFRSAGAGFTVHILFMVACSCEIKEVRLETIVWLLSAKMGWTLLPRQPAWGMMKPCVVRRRILSSPSYCTGFDAHVLCLSITLLRLKIHTTHLVHVKQSDHGTIPILLNQLTE